MAQAPSEDTLITVTGDVAQQHVDKYYRAMNRERDTLPSYYAAQQALPDGSQIPTILFNGVTKDATTFRDLVRDFNGISHDIQSFDCQVINPDFQADGGTSNQTSSQGRSATLAILVSGIVKIGPLKEAETHGFSETFVLTPNPAYSKDRRNKSAREWLIQSQCFRFVS